MDATVISLRGCVQAYINYMNAVDYPEISGQLN